MKSWMIVFGLMAAALFTAGHAMAQGSGHSHGAGHEGAQQYGGSHQHESAGPPGDFPWTSEQKAKFQELRRKFKLENGQLIGSLIGKKIELMALWSDPKADPKTIAEKEKEFASLKYQLREKMVQAKLEARKFFTPEQIAHYGMHLGARFKKMMGHGGMRGHRGMMEHGGKAGHGGMMDRGGMMGRGGMMCGCRMGSGQGMGHGMGHGMGGMSHGGMGQGAGGMGGMGHGMGHGTGGMGGMGMCN